MRVMAIIIARSEGPPDVWPGDPLREQMRQFNEQLVRAGVMLAGERLHSRGEAVRVLFPDGRQAVVESPVATDGARICGFWLWQVRSMDEAIEWAKRSPRPREDGAGIEIRQVLELNG
jgi:hypothetical protein